jgi:hypothetical protein
MASFLPAIIFTLAITAWSVADIIPGDSTPLFISKLLPQRGSQISSVLVVFLWILMSAKAEWKSIAKTKVSESSKSYLKNFILLNSIIVGLLGLFATMSFTSKYDFIIPLVAIYIASIAFAFAISLATVQARSAHLIPLLFLMFLSTGFVNPVQSGLGKLHSSDIRDEIRKVLPPDGLAAGVGMQEDALLQLNGIPIMGGQMNIGPNKEKWLMFDPTLRYLENWNRGASYLIFIPRNGNFEVSNPTMDQVIVYYDPCKMHKEFKELKMIVSFVAQDYTCLKLASTLSLGVNKIPLYLYSRT